MLEKIIKGKIKKPLLLCLFGTEGVGKTTFASKSEKPVFVGPESGNDNLDVSRFPTPKTWTELLSQISALSNEAHEYKTLVVDSIDWCERLMHSELIIRHNVKTIEDVAGGYGRYVSVVNTEWMQLIDMVRSLRDLKKMNIIFIAHYMVKTFNDPMTQMPYDRYQMKLLDKSSALFREFVDVLGFATFEVSVKGTGTKGKGIGDGYRVLYTEKRPAHDAKNRFSLPYAIPFDFETFSAHMNSSDIDQLKNIKQDIADMMLDIKEEELLAKVKTTLEKAKDDFVTLSAIKNRLTQVLNKE
jgi:hypothetical protein